MEAEGLQDSFEQQYNKGITLDFPEGKVTVVDVSPPILSDITPVLFAPGWSENQETYRKALREGYAFGRRCLALGYSRRGGEVMKEEEYPEAELRKAELLLRVLKEKEIGRTDVIAHSEGAVNSLIAATIQPESFRNIVLDKPAGLLGKT